ncbi:uncharacterized protein METZ01_LOCUS469975, partial [marine metagenome]
RSLASITPRVSALISSIMAWRGYIFIRSTNRAPRFKLCETSTSPH